MGVVNDEYGQEKLVIIDSGLTDDVWADYYKPKQVNYKY